MANVFRAEELGPEGQVLRNVAIKRVLPGLAADKRFAQMFQEEARVIADLEHANISRFLEVGRDVEGDFFIVMEWVDGVDFAVICNTERVEARPLPWEDVAAIGLSVARALQAAHSRASAPVFHRDVTPGNILIAATGDVKLTDFGLARAMDRITITTPGSVIGKMAYLAPEMLADTKPSASTDLYSLGVVMWEALSGRRLFATQDEVRLFMLVGRGDIPPIAGLRPDAPEALVQAVVRLTEKQPEERYADAAALIDVLEALDVGERQASLSALCARADTRAPISVFPR